MGTLEQALQELHEAGKRIEISWLWDGGVEVNAEGEERNFGLVSEVLPWLQHWFGLKDRGARPDALATELQKIYDSEINITIRTGGKEVFVGLGNDFTGFKAEGTVAKGSEVLPRLQKAIHKHSPISKYDVERLGGEFTLEMAEYREQ
jgi:hypothetical protein